MPSNGGLNTSPPMVLLFLEAAMGLSLAYTADATLDLVASPPFWARTQETRAMISPLTSSETASAAEAVLVVVVFLAEVAILAPGREMTFSMTRMALPC